MSMEQTAVAVLETEIPAGDQEQDTLALCKAAGDSLRMAALRVLRRDAFSVQELCAILDVRQSALSHHLKILAKAGLVISRREGNSIFYRRSSEALNPALNELQQSLLHSIDQLPLNPNHADGREQVYADRAQRSQAFFAQNAGSFSSQQEQIAAFELYASTTAGLLESTQANGGELAIEVGPGHGEFLAALSPRYQRVIALDNAASMLALAQDEASELHNIEFIHGDTRAPALPQGQADCVVVNMVLHHVPSPADIFADAARLLKPGGILSVTDLCSHDQNWAQEACGDLWLGFEPEDLNQWAAAAGLSEGASDYLAQRNGFRIQVRQFTKPQKTNP